MNIDRIRIKMNDHGVKGGSFRSAWGTPALKIKYVYADVTNPAGYGKKIIVNLCNTNGKWEGTNCLAISQKWKKVKKEYKKWFKKGQTNKSGLPFRLGEVQVLDVTKRGWFSNKPADLWVANILGLDGEPKGYSYPFKISAVKKGLKRIASFAETQNATLHMPKIGCQRVEGGKWELVEQQIIEEVLSQGVPVVVYDVN